MLVSHSKKIAVHLNPKTASQSLYEAFLGCGLDVCIFSCGHETFDEEGYTVYSFYRNPVDRFVSALNHVRKVQRHYEIYIVEAVEGITKDDIREMFESNPQMAADTIRRLGTCFHSDKVDKDNRVIV